MKTTKQSMESMIFLSGLSFDNPNGSQALGRCHTSFSPVATPKRRPVFLINSRSGLFITLQGYPFSQSYRINLPSSLEISYSSPIVHLYLPTCVSFSTGTPILTQNSFSSRRHLHIKWLNLSSTNYSNHP